MGIEKKIAMNITAIRHYDELLGKGYYLVTEHMDKTWYKGETAVEAVQNFLKDKDIHVVNITIVEKV